MEYYVLQAKELYKKYKGFTALNGLTINVPRGAIYGLVGRKQAKQRLSALSADFNSLQRASMNYTA